MTRVSVVIPVYNAYEWIEDAVQSVLDQDHPDLEVIIIDDGSTDAKTVALMENPPWHGVKVFRQANQGVAAARNMAIASATGDYILPVGADDYISPTYASKAAQVLDSEPETGIVYSLAEFMGDSTGPWQLPPYSLKLMLTEGIIFATSMFRKEDWSKVGGYDTTLHFREDHDFWLKIVGLGRGVHRIDEVLFRYRSRTGSMNSEFTREELVATYAQIMRNNSSLYLDNADLLFSAWFERTDEITDYRHRYRRLERVIDKHPRAYDVLRRVKRALT